MIWWDRFVCWLTGGVHWWTWRKREDRWRCSDCDKPFVAGKDIP
jgi:transposase-like protein